MSLDYSCVPNHPGLYETLSKKNKPITMKKNTKSKQVKKNQQQKASKGWQSPSCCCSSERRKDSASWEGSVQVIDPDTNVSVGLRNNSRMCFSLFPHSPYLKFNKYFLYEINVTAVHCYKLKKKQKVSNNITLQRHNSTYP